MATQSVTVVRIYVREGEHAVVKLMKFLQNEAKVAGATVLRAGVPAGLFAMKARIRAAAEEEERVFYSGGGGDEWLSALEPIGTGVEKPHLTTAPWLIVVFAQRWGHTDEGTRYKNYYVPESVGIATGFLVTALHQAGLVCLTHTPNPMKFLNGLCGRPESEKPVMILPVGHAAPEATVPAVAKRKKPRDQVMTVFG